MTFSARLLTVGLLLLGFQLSAAMAETWPGFRGASGDGVSHEKNLPSQWSLDNNLLWKIDLNGRGNSSPAVTSDRIYLTSQRLDKSLWVIAIDRNTGKIAWSKKVGSGSLVAKGPANLYAYRHNPATPTPSADEKYVWAFFGDGLLVCLNRDGKQIWRRDMVKDHGEYDITFGMGSSPRLWGDLLYVSCLTKGPSYVVALNKLTGKKVWKKTRKLPASDDGPDAYSTPAIYEAKSGPQLVVSGSDHVNAYQPTTGKSLWTSAGLKIDSVYGRVIASPAVADGAIVAVSGNPGGGGKGHSIVIRIDGGGSASQSVPLSEDGKSSPDSSTPVCLGSKVYLMADNGVGSCIDLNSHEVLWHKRLGPGPFHASVVAGDGKIYFHNIGGDCVVVEAGAAGKVLATNHLPGTFYATPAISDGVIYLRAYETLYAVGRK